MKITREILYLCGTYKDELRWFRERFPDGVTVSDVGAFIEALRMDNPDLLVWLLAKLPVECVRDMLEHGARPNAKDSCGNTPLHYARLAQIAEALLDHGADPNVRGEDGMTPLHHAFTSKVADVLIQHGADPNARDDAMRTPLHTVGTPEVARALLAHGADPNALDEEGMTPLDYALESQSLGIVSVLNKATVHLPARCERH